MFMRGLFQIDMTRKKEIPALRYEERGLFVLPCLEVRLES